MVGFPIDAELDGFTLLNLNTTSAESEDWVRLVSKDDNFEKGLIFAIEPPLEAAGANFTITFTLAELAPEEGVLDELLEAEFTINVFVTDPDLLNDTVPEFSPSGPSQGANTNKNSPAFEATMG